VSQKIVTKGICSHCKKLVTRVSAHKHIKACFIESEKSVSSYLIKAVWPHKNPIYWLYVAVPLKSTLSKLDDFFREIWLECCGHLSLFNINNVLFSSYVEPNPYERTLELPMTIKIENALSVGQKFAHEYDFGTTTELLLEVVDLIKSENKIQLLMRNEEPPFLCSCKAKASYIDSNEYTYWCEDCKSDDDDTYNLPLVNSPRTGFCGYCG